MFSQFRRLLEHVPVFESYSWNKSGTSKPFVCVLHEDLVSCHTTGKEEWTLGRGNLG